MHKNINEVKKEDVEKYIRNQIDFHSKCLSDLRKGLKQLREI